MMALTVAFALLFLSVSKKSSECWFRKYAFETVQLHNLTWHYVHVTNRECKELTISQRSHVFTKELQNVLVYKSKTLLDVHCQMSKTSKDTKSLTPHSCETQRNISQQRTDHTFLGSQGSAKNRFVVTTGGPGY